MGFFGLGKKKTPVRDPLKPGYAVDADATTLPLKSSEPITPFIGPDAPTLPMPERQRPNVNQSSFPPADNFPPRDGFP